ncbi:MAG: TldD/PmbA family protein, partial [Micromonosporaceae bacterium]
MTEFDVAVAAVDAALAAGARYADARVMYRRSESMQARNGDIEELLQDEDAGIGVRALLGANWGFSAIPNLSDKAAAAAGTGAAAIAAASAAVPGPPVDLLGVTPVTASWSSACEVDPLAVPLSDKGDLLVAATAAARAAGADLAEGIYQIWDTRKWFVSSEGHRIDQHLRECGAGISATVIGDGETQRRSYPSYRGHYAGRGWELVAELDLRSHAERVAEEARALVTAPVCPATTTNLILGAEQMALQIHESVGHAIELDRILGWEAAFAGTSWLDLAQLGQLRYGSELMNITIDPTRPGALGSFGFDDEGTQATPRDAVRDGTWVGVLAGRDSAAVAGLDYGGS